MSSSRPVFYIGRIETSVVQSGNARDKAWEGRFALGTHSYADPLMGWNSSETPLDQIVLKFNTLEEAIAYAQGCDLDYVVRPNLRGRAILKRCYADNFGYNRRENWTH